MREMSCADTVALSQNLLFQVMEIGKINIDGPYGNLLNKMVSEMASREYNLKTIESYVLQMENFLSTISSPNIDISDLKIYLNRTLSSSTLEALHFFFREVLPSTTQEQLGQAIKPAHQSLTLQDSLYPVLVV